MVKPISALLCLHFCKIVQAVFRYYCIECPSCPASAIQMGQALGNLGSNKEIQPQ